MAYSKVIQTYIYIYPFFFQILCIIQYHKILNIVPLCFTVDPCLFVFYIVDTCGTFSHSQPWSMPILLKHINVGCSVMSDSLQPPWTVPLQAPLSMEFSRQEYWSGYSHSRGSSQPRDQTWVSCNAGRFPTQPYIPPYFSRLHHRGANLYHCRTVSCFCSELQGEYPGFVRPEADTILGALFNKK